MKIGSLFDGSGGFPLAGILCGIEPAWASEVKPYPIAVTTSRIPHMKHLGNVSLINGAEIEPVDIVTFGSPCQDVSRAGKRKGVKHKVNGDEETTRSGMFFEAVRIIKEMRAATNGLYPTFALWENVPGAFTSNGGDDFMVVLDELVQIVAPGVSVPRSEKWCNAGEIVGEGWSLAWRVLNAQFFGVPHSRRRIFCVLDLAGNRAGQILFEREGCPWNPETFGAAWKRTETDSERSSASDNRAVVCYDARGNGDGEIVNTITGDHENRVTDYTSIVVECCIDGDKIGKAERAGGSGLGIRDGDTMYTLTAKDVHAVCFAMQAFGKYKESDTASTLKARDYKDATDLICDTIKLIVRRLTPTECARLQGFPDTWGIPDHKDALTDEEYAFWTEVRCTWSVINGKEPKTYSRDQMLKWYNKLHTDSAEYEMWGNGVALPVVLYVMQGMAEHLK